MKKFLTGVAMMASILTGLFAGKAANAEPITISKGKAVVVFFSWSPSGNTRFAAQTVAKKLGAETFEIKAEKPYNSVYAKCIEEAKPECYGKKLRAFLPIQGLDLNKYDAVFVGTPDWWGTMAPPVRTWVTQNAEILKRKMVCIFQTNGGGGMQRVGDEFAELLPGAKILPPAAFAGYSVKSSVKELEKFVDERIAVKSTQENADGWDKVFPLSDNVNHTKVTFKNHFGITLMADVYTPKDASGKLPAIAVGGPFGAVKEQVSGLYAMRMAERGFVAVAADPSYMGESGGEPRGVNSPDLNTEDFQAAVDYLTTRSDVDVERIGIIGICGWGGFGINTAAIDTRIKATAIITMYDMTRVYANDYNDANDNEAARYAKRKALSDQRTADAKNGSYARVSPLPNPEDLTAESPQFLKDYVDFYKTSRGYHKRSIGSNGGWLAQTFTSLQNVRILDFASEIRNPVLLVHGEKAHSRYFSEGAFEKMTGEKPVFKEGEWSCKRGNKELLLVPGAVHCDLYDDRAGVIPYGKIESFFNDNLK